MKSCQRVKTTALVEYPVAIEQDGKTYYRCSEPAEVPKSQKYIKSEEQVQTPKETGFALKMPEEPFPWNSDKFEKLLDKRAHSEHSSLYKQSVQWGMTKVNNVTAYESL